MKLRSIEALRGLAAFSVAVAHCDAMIAESPALPFRHPWHAIAVPGTAGVEFFFVLSGFVMAVAHRADLAHGGNIPRFLWRRFVRIYPLYWVVLAVPLYRFWGAPLLSPDAIAAWLSLLPIRTDNLLVVAWTLRQEVTFYAVLALCLLPRVGRAVLALWIVATAIRWFVVPLPPMGPLPTILVSHLLSLFNFEFFAGLLAGTLLPRWPRSPGLGWLLAGAGAGLVAVRMAIDSWGAVYGPPEARLVYGAGYAAILLGLASLEGQGALRFGRAAAWGAGVAGALSYPLYLSHLLTLDYVAMWAGPSGWAAALGPGLTVALLLAVALAVAAALSVLVDRPIQRLARRIGRPRRAQAAPARA